MPDNANSVDLTDQQLIDGCVSGDQASWAIFVKHFNKLIYHSIYKTLRVNAKPTDPDDINDLFQDLFASICADNCKKLRMFDPCKGVSLASWLRMIAVRMTIDHLRKQRSSTSLEDLLTEPSRDGGQEMRIDDESLQCLRGVLEELSDKDKLLIELFYFKELPPEEIARILNISVGAIYTRKNRIIEKIREIARQRNIL
jgi:RNA polymerase sigma-70 factor (ECF subfamily)